MGEELIVRSYKHLPVADQLSMIKLLIFIDGRIAIKNFEKQIKEIIK